MAEFPGFGRHCSFSDCHRLDFLPVRCDACGKDFCANHFSYASHRCESSSQKDVQVPVCPLCGKVIPVARGELPDERVGRHIDSDCKSDPARSSRGQIYKNRCSKPGCKKRELIPMKCVKCSQNFCIAHRLPMDHECGSNASSSARITPAGQAALARQKQKASASTSAGQPHARPAQTKVADMSEDEMLARALQASLNGNNSPALSPEELDRALAEELQRKEYQAQLQPQRSTGNSSSADKCVLS